MAVNRNGSERYLFYKTTYRRRSGWPPLRLAAPPEIPLFGIFQWQSAISPASLNSMDKGIRIIGPADAGRDILTPEALDFVALLSRSFSAQRKALLVKRDERQARLDANELPDFLPETRPVRESAWAIAP